MVGIFHKIHKMTGEGEILAVADKELVGKTLKCGKVEFEVSEQFYKGQEISKEELKKILHEFGNINLVGNRAVETALKEKLANAEQVIEIGGVKHLQIIVL